LLTGRAQERGYLLLYTGEKKKKKIIRLTHRGHQSEEEKDRRQLALIRPGSALSLPRGGEPREPPNVRSSDRPGRGGKKKREGISPVKEISSLSSHA